MLKKRVKDINSVEEQFRSLYKQVGDEWVLDGVEGIGEIDSLKAKVDEFRENNIKANKAREELEARFAGVDPEEYKRMKEEALAAKDKKLIDEGKIEELLHERTERMRKDYEGQIDALKKALTAEQEKSGKLDSQLTSVLIDSEITQAVSKVGVPQKGALDYILQVARTQWKLEDGKPVCRKADGSPVFGKDPNKYIDFMEWAQDIANTSPYLFEGASGIGSQGSGKEKGSLGKSRDDIMKIDPEQRLGMLHQSGVKR